MVMLISLFINSSCYALTVDIEFLYFKPPYCPTCPGDQSPYQVYLHNSRIVQRIKQDYGEKVNVQWIYFFSDEGLEKVKEYNISYYYLNSIVVNHETVFLGGDQFINETYLRKVIDFYLGITSQAVHDVAVLSVFPSANEFLIGQIVDVTVLVKNKGIFTEFLDIALYTNSTLIEQLYLDGLDSNESRMLTFRWNTTGFEEGNYLLSAKIKPVSNETNVTDNLFDGGIVKLRKNVDSSLSLTFLGMLITAFSLGFFETFSPCLIILLSFILSYTLGDKRKFKESFLRILVFGLGFVSASAILGLACAVFFFSVPSLQYLLTWIVCVFAVIFGLNLLGILRFQVQTKPLVRKFIEKYGFTILGIFLLGFVFYFLDPCIAPIFVAIVPLLFSDLFLLILLVFCMGAIIPFIVIGIFVGSISKLTRSVYRHKVVFRGASGIILMCYALYLIFFYLL